MKKRTWILSMILTIVFAFSSNGYSQLLSVSINPFIAQPSGMPSYSNNITGTFNALVTVTNISNNSLPPKEISFQGFTLQG